MKINRLQNDQGEFRCFEIDNAIISRNGVDKVVAQVTDVKITHFPKFYDDEVFCGFELNGHKLEISEPYGDSPIKGGDVGQRLFFFMNWVIGTAIWIGIGSAAFWGYNCAFS